MLTSAAASSSCGRRAPRAWRISRSRWRRPGTRSSRRSARSRNVWMDGANGAWKMKIVKSNEAAWADAMNKGAFGQRRKELGSTGKMSAGLWELPPGKKSFPFHMHHVTEEALFVVSGHAKVRTPEGLTPVSAGDWVMFPPGDGAHQLINDGSEPMVYIALGVGMGVD